MFGLLLRLDEIRQRTVNEVGSKYTYSFGNEAPLEERASGLSMV